MKAKLLLLLMCIAFFEPLIAQRRAQIEKVTDQNKIQGEPYIILPKTAARFTISLATFKYTAGDELNNLIQIRNTGNCSPERMKAELQIFEKKYGVSSDVLIKFFTSRTFTKEVTSNKIDPEIKTSFVSVADYDKVYKYTGIKRSLMNSRLLNLQYDENGLLVSSKQTNESKLLPFIFNTLSGITSLATVLKRSGGDDGGAAASPQVIGNANSCFTINLSCTKKLDDAIEAYNTWLSTSNYYVDKNFEEAKKKKEEEIAKAYEELFFSKEITITPIQLTFVIPGKEADGPNNNSKNFVLFSFDKAKNILLINDAYKEHIMAFPQDKVDFKPVDSLTKPYTVSLSSVGTAFDRGTALSSKMGEPEGKKTAVYNVPRSERFRLQNSGDKETAAIDTIIKVPQHGPLGYFNLRLSSLELTYDANGELKSFAAETKSAIDERVTTGTGVMKEIVTFAKGKSEIDVLKEKADRLELEKKIRDLEKQPE